MFKLFKKIPYFEALRAFLEQWGLWGWVSVMFVTVTGFLYTWGTWFFYAVPVWIVPLLGMSLVAAVVVIFYYGLLIKRWLRAYRIDLPALGDRLIEFSSRFSRALNDYERASSGLAAPARPRDSESGYQEWAHAVAASKLKSHWLSEAFGGELVYFLRELARLGIPLPFHLTASIEYGAAGLSAYLSYVGRMLEEGRLEELKATDRDADWTINGMFR